MAFLVLIMLVGIVFCIMIAIPSIEEGTKNGKSDYLGGGILLIIIAIILFLIIGSIEIYPTCTLDGLL